VIDMDVAPHLEAADSDLLRDTIRHHDQLIGPVMGAAAERHRKLHRAPGDPLSPLLLVSPMELEGMTRRFMLILEVACELASRPPPGHGGA
jgi:hypothetical protein